MSSQNMLYGRDCVCRNRITAYWMAKWPETFYLWYTGKSLLLYVLRFLIYKSKKQHYFLLEMCYAVSLGVIVHHKISLWCFVVCTSPCTHGYRS